MPLPDDRDVGKGAESAPMVPSDGGSRDANDAPIDHPLRPRFRRSRGALVVLGVLVGGGGVSAWAIAWNAKIPLVSVLGPMIGGALVGAAGGVVTYSLLRRRHRGNRGMPSLTTWVAASLGAAGAALLRQMPGVPKAAIQGILLGMLATLVFIVNVWPASFEPSRRE